MKRSSTTPTRRRDFLRNTGLGLAAAGLTSCGRGPKPQPNIVWIIAEDFSPDLGCYGNKDVYTPNIDRMAAEGVRYTNACVTAPVCSAARSALMVGMYQTSVGGHNHRSHRNDGYRLPAGVRPFTAYFRESGYHTSNVKDSPIGGRGKTDFNYNLDEPAFDGADWTERADGQPFYAQINFQETHRAFKAFPDRPIDPDTVELPPYYPDHPVVRRDWALYLETAQHLDRRVEAVRGRLEEQGLAQDTIIFFFGDHGRPMPRGKQFLYEGGIKIPFIVYIPEKFQPSGWTPGSVNDDLISHIDFTATSLALAGIEPPANMQGQVFIGDDADPVRTHLFAARDRCDETVDRIRAVRTKRWKYIRNGYPDRPYTQPNHYKDTSYPGLQVMRHLKAEGKLTVAQSLFMADRRPAEELYDLEADPFEVQNLAGGAEQETTLNELRAELDKWIVETHDLGQTPEDPIPEEFKLRTRVDDWTTATGFLSKSDGLARMEWNAGRNLVQLPYIVEPGQFVLRFRARSNDLAPERLVWGTVSNVNGQGNEAAISFQQDGSWQDVSAEFEPDTWLFTIGLDFGKDRGVIEFDWMRLFRREGRNLKMIREWTFA